MTGDREGAGSDRQRVDRGVREVLDIVRGIASELDLDVVLERVAEAARELSEARYAALGVLDERGSELGRFITTGIDEETRRRIGALPRGHGVLGELIEQPETLRLDDVGRHPRSYGFPPEHPPMKSFLGVPVMVGGRPYGNLYLTEKEGGGPFDEVDERNVELLADLAGMAIDNAWRYSQLEARHTELRQSVEALEATMQIARALGGQTDLHAILQLVAKRGRALVAARIVVIEYAEYDELVVAAAAGEVAPGVVGRRVAIAGTVAQAALQTETTLRLEDDVNMARFDRHGLGHEGVGARAGLVVPLLFRGRAHGVLIAIDRLRDGPRFTLADKRLLEAFAASAATAIATAETAEAERRRQTLAAAEQERARWARELHDETLQNLAAVRIGLAAELRRRSDPVELRATVQESVELLEREMAMLRALITDLRPAALDEVGTEAAIEDLIDRARSRGLEVDLSLDLAYERGDRPDRLTSDLETAVYRIIQEALNNAQRHGKAGHARVEVEEDETDVRVAIRDDGRGFDTTQRTTGFGLPGMRERAELVGGALEIASAPGEGTTVRATLPVRRRGIFRAA